MGVISEHCFLLGFGGGTSALDASLWPKGAARDQAVPELGVVSVRGGVNAISQLLLGWVGCRVCGFALLDLTHEVVELLVADARFFASRSESAAGNHPCADSWIEVRMAWSVSRFEPMVVFVLRRPLDLARFDSGE